MNLELLRTTTARTLADYRAAESALAAERTRLEQATARVEAVRQAQLIVQEAAKRVQEEAHAQIGGLVSRCLKAVFGEEAYEFKIVFERKRGKTEAKLVFVRDGEEIDPTQAAGGGTVQIAAFALRLSCLILQTPPVRRLLVIDEGFSMLSKEYRPRLKVLLEALAEEMDLQLILVTHQSDMKLGTVVEMT